MAEKNHSFFAIKNTVTQDAHMLLVALELGKTLSDMSF